MNIMCMVKGNGDAELSNIQTYEKLNGDDFRPILSKFAKVLQEIGLWNDEVRQAFDSFEWKVEGNGFVYSSITEIGHHETKFSEIKVRPLLIVYTPAVDRTFEDNWIVCYLLIETGDLRTYESKGDYCPHTYPLVRSLVKAMASAFKQTGVYFTDEAQDGSDFDGIRTSDPKALWQFDYAIIPNKLRHIYQSPPASHQVQAFDTHFESWYAERWKENEKTRSTRTI